MNNQYSGPAENYTFVMGTTGSSKPKKNKSVTKKPKNNNQSGVPISEQYHQGREKIAVDMITDNITYNLVNHDYYNMYRLANNAMNNIFLKIDQKKQIRKNIQDFMHKRWLSIKFIHKLRQLYIKNTKPINEVFIDQYEVEDSDPDTYIRLLTEKPNKVYAFKPDEIMSLFSASFAIHDYTDPTPKIACNPYTSREFTIGEIVYLFDSIGRANIKLPLILEIYKTTRYNFDKFVSITYDILEENATREYVQELSFANFVELINENAGNRYLRRICDKFTYNSIHDKRKELEVILIKIMTDQLDDITEDSKPNSHVTFNYGSLHNVTTQEEWSTMIIPDYDRIDLDVYIPRDVDNDVLSAIDEINRHELDPLDEPDYESDSESESESESDTLTLVGVDEISNSDNEVLFGSNISLNDVASRIVQGAFGDDVEVEVEIITERARSETPEPGIYHMESGEI